MRGIDARSEEVIQVLDTATTWPRLSQSSVRFRHGNWPERNRWKTSGGFPETASHVRRAFLMATASKSIERALHVGIAFVSYPDREMVSHPVHQVRQVD